MHTYIRSERLPVDFILDNSPHACSLCWLIFNSCNLANIVSVIFDLIVNIRRACQSFLCLYRGVCPFLFLTKYVVTSFRGTKPFKLKFRTNRGLVSALVPPLCASCSQKMYISSLLEREILLRKPYAANQRGENIDMHFFANDDRNSISPNCHLIVIRWFYHDDTKNL